MRNKRLLAVLLTFVVMFSFFATRSASAQAPVTIKMWSIAVSSGQTNAAELAMVDRFNKAHKDVQVSLSLIQNDDFKLQSQIAIAAGQAPDIFQTWGGGVLQSYVAAGVVRDVNFGSSLSKFSAGALAPATFNGKHYGVPVTLASVFLWTNVDLLTANKLPMPDTWANFIADCKGLKAAGITPVQVGNKDKWPGAFWMDYLVMRIGGTSTFTDASNHANGVKFTDAPFVAAGKAIQDAVDANCFEAGVNGNPYDQSLIGTGQAAMQLQGDWNLGGLKQVDPDLTAKSIRPLTFPVVEGGKGAATDFLGGTGEAFAISAKAPAQADAALIEMLSSDQFGKDIAAASLLPALVGYDKGIQDPLEQQMAKSLGGATYVQLYWDQFLPPALAQVSLQTTQDLFGKTTTPEKAAGDLEAAAEKAAAAATAVSK